MNVRGFLLETSSTREVQFADVDVTVLIILVCDTEEIHGPLGELLFPALGRTWDKFETTAVSDAEFCLAVAVLVLNRLLVLAPVCFGLLSETTEQFGVLERLQRKGAAVNNKDFVWPYVRIIPTAVSLPLYE